MFDGSENEEEVWRVERVRSGYIYCVQRGQSCQGHTDNEARGQLKR